MGAIRLSPDGDSIYRKAVPSSDLGKIGRRALLTFSLAWNTLSKIPFRWQHPS